MFRHSWVDSTGRNSLGDINGGTAELDSAGSSPGVQKVRFIYIKWINSKINLNIFLAIIEITRRGTYIW